jgi:hypothetical protein
MPDLFHFGQPNPPRRERAGNAEAPPPIANRPHRGNHAAANQSVYRPAFATPWS